jgi:hypothetical protein
MCGGIVCTVQRPCTASLHIYLLQGRAVSQKVPFVMNGVKQILDASFEFFTAVKFEVEVFWVVTPCNIAVG